MRARARARARARLRTGSREGALTRVPAATRIDVMREVSIYDTVDPSGRYSVKVRSLTQFYHKRCVGSARVVRLLRLRSLTRPSTCAVRRASRSASGLDEIDDPLYASVEPGGAAEVAAVTACAAVLASCCEGLAAELQALAADVAKAQPGGAATLRAALATRLDGMSPMDWLRPPMLSKKK